MQVGRLEIVKLFFKHLNNLLISSFKEEQYKKNTHTLQYSYTFVMYSSLFFFCCLYNIYIYIYCFLFIFIKIKKFV